MRPSDRITIASAVASQLEPKGWEYAETVLDQLGVITSAHTASDLEVFVIRCLGDAPDDVLIGVADHFQITVSGADSTGPQLWREDHYRLFVSHVAAHKGIAHELSEALETWAISGFVAHDDIHPSLPWQAEIERALWTMDAMVALVTPDFPASHWTDQEVGFALGRGLLVIPVRLGHDPYGFFGRQQGIQGAGRSGWQLAESVFEALVENRITRGSMIMPALHAFAESPSFRGAEARAEILLKFDRLSPARLELAQEACMTNVQISDAHGCPEIIGRLYQKHGFVPREVPSRQPAWQDLLNAV